MNEEARRIWQAKLELLLAEEAKAFDPAAKFKIREDIAEARRMLEELTPEAKSAQEPERLNMGALSQLVSEFLKVGRSRRLLFDTLSRIANRGPLPFADRNGIKPHYSNLLVPEKRVFREYLEACRKSPFLCRKDRFICAKYLNVAEWESVEVQTLEFIAVCLLLGGRKERIAASRYAQTASENVRKFARQQGFGQEQFFGDLAASETLTLIRECEKKLQCEREVRPR